MSRQESKPAEPPGQEPSTSSNADPLADAGTHSVALIDEVQTTVEKHLESSEPWAELTRNQEQILARLEDLAVLKDLSRLQDDAEQKIQGLQTALTMSHQEQVRCQNELENRCDDLQKKSDEIQQLQQKLDEAQRDRNEAQGKERQLESRIEELERQCESLQEQLRSVPSSDEPSQAADTSPAAPEPATEVAPEIETMADSDSNGAGWEQQKLELMRKYGLETEEKSEPDHSPQPQNDLANDCELEDDFEVKGLNVSEIDEPSGELPKRIENDIDPVVNEDVLEDNFAIAGLNVSAIEERQAGSENDAKALEEAKLANLEEQKKNEIELAIERARISRQRRELEEKIISLQMDVSESEKKNKPGKKRNLLSRMTQFLKRDEKSTSESRIENMVRLVDSIKEKKDQMKTPQYHDPRDQPFMENLEVETAEADSKPVDEGSKGDVEGLVGPEEDEPPKQEPIDESTETNSAECSDDLTQVESKAEPSTPDREKRVSAKASKKPKRRKNRKKGRR